MAGQKSGQAKKKSGRAGPAPKKSPAKDPKDPKAEELAATNGTPLQVLYTAAPCGNGHHLVTAETGHHTLGPDGQWVGPVQTVHFKDMDLYDARQRAVFVDELLAKESRADRDTATKSLEELADYLGMHARGELADYLAKLYGGEAESEVSVDASSLVRPEMFYTPEVCGLTVPVTAPVDGKLESRWKVYLRHANGRRECRDLEECIQLPSKGALWVHPVPGAPGPKTKSGWSARGQQNWLAGKGDPDPAEVFQRLCEQIRRFLVFSKAGEARTVSTLALWVALSYVYQAWDSVPYLYVGGPFGSGKSRVLKVLNELVYRPTLTNETSVAAIYRTLEAKGGTLLWDEAEGLKRTAKDPSPIRPLLLSGYQRGGGIMRCGTAEQNYDPTQFEVYGPKAFACITGLDKTMLSRCITIHMMRAGAGSAEARRRLDEDATAWEGLRDALHALALSNGPTWPELSRQDHMIPEGIHDRDYELWQPLLALASWFEGKGVEGLLDLMRGHALAAIEAEKEDHLPGPDEILLLALTRYRQKDLCPTSTQLLEAVQGEASPYADLFPKEGSDKWSPDRVGKRLQKYGLRSEKVGRQRGYKTPLRKLWNIQQRHGFNLDLTEERAGLAGDT